MANKQTSVMLDLLTSLRVTSRCDRQVKNTEKGAGNIPKDMQDNIQYSTTKQNTCDCLLLFLYFKAHVISFRFKSVTCFGPLRRQMLIKLTAVSFVE